MKRLYILIFICAAWLPLKAQVDVSIQILPPYPTKITDYASRPQLMVIAVRNTSGQTQKIQLRGAVTGDNGIELRVKANYKSITPITLARGEVRMLNGNDLKYFFDYTKIDYKGITQNDFINKNGLPEGTYRFCIRAYDYDSNAPISADEPVGCSNTFTISSVEPPTIIAPMADASITAQSGQIVLFQWSTPPGTSPQLMSAVRYRLRMVEVIGDRNPNNALMAAQKPYFFEKEVMGNAYVYNAADPQLTPGRKYAFVVQAFDPFNQTPFRNNGLSEVRSFTYTSPPTFSQVLPPGTFPTQPSAGQQVPIIGAVATPSTGNTPDCDCKITAPTGTSGNAQVTVGAQIGVNNFVMNVSSVSIGANGLLNGEGTIPLPFVGNTPGAKLRVEFSDLDVNTQLKMKGGDVHGKLSNDAASLIPVADKPDVSGMELSPGDAKGIGNYFSSHAQQMIDAVRTSANNAGFELPLGLSKGPVTVAISRIHFSATQAWFEAAGAVEMPDAIGDSTTLALSGKNMCISSATDFCKEGTLYLATDFNMSALKMVLKKPGNNALIDPGTSVTFNKSGFQKLTIKADYTFPDGSLIDSVTNKPLTATLAGESRVGSPNGWADWLAKVKIPTFYIAGMKSISFSLGDKDMYYDHSDFQKPDGMPANFASPDGDGTTINTGALTWKGFYIPTIRVNLPQIIKRAGSTGTSLSVTGSQLIIDPSGFTGTIQSGKVLELGDGSLDGWYASIDNVNLQFFKSAFKKSSMVGKLVLPASDKAKTQNQLDYDASLTTPATGGLAYQFKIYPKNGLTFDALYMTVQLDSTSNITVKGDTNSPLVASATLNGALSLSNSTIKIPKMGKINLPHIEFTNLKFMTTSPFIDKNGMEIKLTSTPHTTNGGGGSGQNSGFDYIPDWEPFLGGPSASVMQDSPTPAQMKNDYVADDPSEQSMAGFGFTLGSSGFNLDVQPDKVTVGLGFKGGLSLTAGPIKCQADAAFTLGSGIKKVSDRITWAGLDGKIDSIDFAGGAALGPFGIKGAIKYYNRDDDEGFIGALETDLAGFLTVNMRGRFGTKKDGQGNFNYFDFSALADFGQTGITFAPVPIALYGFGGGIYYNMAQDPNSLPKPDKFPVAPRGVDTDDIPKTKAAPQDPKASDTADALLDFNPSGVVLSPQRGKWGFDATVLFGLTSRNTLDADATFSMGFNYETGGLVSVTLNGNARLLTDVSKPLSERDKVSTGVGSIFINYNTEDKTFLARLDAELGVPYSTDTGILHAKGGGEFCYSPNGWYLKIGQPEGYGMGPNSVTLLDFITGKSYFEVGTLVDPMPGIPQSIKDLVGYGENDQQNDLKKTPAASREYTASGTGDHGLILGSSVEIGHKDKEYHFLMFYGQLNAQMGFDLSLKSGKKCDGIPGAGGPGGWYAQGQAYFGAHALLGIDVDLFLIHGKFTIFDAGAAAVIQAGLPNPVWAKGAIGGHFSILNDAIHSDFHFGFSIGDECVDSNADAFGGLQLISQITPSQNTTDKQPLSTMPGVIFNVKVGGPFKSDNQYINAYFDFDDYENTSKTGAPTKRFFLFSKDCVVAKLNGNVVTNDMIRLDKTGYSLGYQTDTYLAKNTQYTFRVEAKMHEGILLPLQTNPIFDYDHYIQDKKTNKDAMQFMESTFTTDDGFSAIPSSEYAVTAPLHSDNAVITNQYGTTGNEMYLEVKRVINNEQFFKYPAGTTYSARVFANGVKQGKDIPVNMQTATNRLNDGTQSQKNGAGNVIHSGADSHSKWGFTGPVLQRNVDYIVLFIATLPKGSNGDNSTGIITQSSLITGTTMNGKKAVGGGVTIEALQRTISGHLNTLAAGEAIAGGFSFHTSKYATYQEKFANLQISKIHHNVKNNNIMPGMSQLQNKAALKTWKLDTVTAGKYTINLGSGLGGFNFPVDVTFAGEMFSKADLNNSYSDDIFQADYSNYGGIRRNIAIDKLYNGRIEENYGNNYINLSTYLANNTGIAPTDFKVNVVSPGTPQDNGLIYSYIIGGGEVDYTSNQSHTGAKVVGALPQAPTGGSGNMNSMAMPAGLITFVPGYSVGMPILISTLEASNMMYASRGAASFTDPIQKQIDKVTNWAVNPGDNASTAGNGMSNVGTWEGVSTVASGLMTGGINQNQLQGAMQGAMKAGAMH